ncbi:MAG: protein kinase [Planctomycetota bacterium]
MAKRLSNQVKIDMSSTPKFLKSLLASAVIDEAVVNQHIESVGSDDPSKLAKSLIRAGLLTKWQAKYLHSGRTRLRIGSYRLLDRIRRDDYGDRFLAVHEQLDRRVEIQILPDELAQNPELREAFTERAGVAATIDHPNLVHVYDVDEAGGRFYLILEHVEGKTLGEQVPNGLVPLDVARVVRQAISGLSMAHNNRIIHGQLRPRNILVSDRNEIKIQNLLLPTLMNPSPEQTAAKDMNDAAIVGRKLLKKVCSLDHALLANESVRELDGLLGSLSRSSAEQLPELTSGLDNWIASQSDPGDAVLSASPVVLAAVPRSRKPGRLPANSAAPPAGEPDHPGNDGSQSAFQQRPVLFMSLAFACSLILVGGLGWAGFAMTYQGSGTEQVANSEQPDSGDNADSSDREPRRGDDRRSARTSTLLSPEQIAAAQSQLDSGQNEDANSRTDSADAGAEDSTAADDVEEQSVAAEETASDEAIGGVGETVAISLPAPDATPPAAEQPASESSPVTAEPPAGGGAVPDGAMAAGSPDPPVAAAASLTEEQKADPFQALPRATDLPPIESLAQHDISEIFVPSNYLMALELVSGQEIAKSRISFEAVRSTENRQLWEIKLKSRPRDEPVTIAKFFKNDLQFSFIWTPAASENEDANYLRNCFLKLSGNNDKIAYLKLREPVVIENFVLNEEEMYAELSTEIAWLPRTENLRLEIQTMRYPGIPKPHETGGRLMLEPRTVAQREPAIFWFRENPQERMMWIEMVVTGRRVLSVEAQMFVNIGSGAVKVSAEDVLGLANSLRLASEQSFALRDQMRAAQRPEDIKAEDWDRMNSDASRAADDAKKRALIASEAATVVPDLISKNLPFVVYFEMEGIRTEIAICNPTR